MVVCFCHGFPYLKEVGYPIWGGQIPLFFLIQIFHCYKREPKSINWNMIIKRIFLPFLIIQILIFGMLLLTGEYESLSRIIKVCVSRGGLGPGSYYPWIFVQMAIIIPLMRPLCQKIDKCKSLFIFILISEAIEIVCSIIDLPDAIYRLLCLRYIMLIWFGWMWAKEGIKMNFTTIIISILSLGLVIYFGYFSRSTEPWLYETGWSTHRWPCYFWVGIMFVSALYKVYVTVNKYEIVKKTTSVLASASYEIFLIQMMYYAVMQPKYFTIINSEYLKYGLWLIMALVISLSGGIGLFKFESKCIFNQKKKQCKIS